MREKTKVSLILTSFNCRENLKRTLAGIEAQDYNNLEIVIVDGASTDGTVDVIKDFAGKTRHECVWVSEKDAGIYDAMNKGFGLSTGDVLAFFNDLFLRDDAISLLLHAMEREQADGVHADLIYATEDRVKRRWRMGQGEIKKGWMPGHPTLYLKREIYERYGLYDKSYKCSADYEFMVRILKDGKVKLAYVPRTLVRMYYGGASTQNAGSYLVSVLEAHRALKENAVRGAWWIVFLRTLKVTMQFLRAGAEGITAHSDSSL